jgi:hypothetical protein
MKRLFHVTYTSSSRLTHPDPYHDDDTDAKASDKREKHEHITIIIIWIESKELLTQTSIRVSFTETKLGRKTQNTRFA